MSQDLVFRISRISDKQLNKLFTDIIEDFPNAKAHYTYPGSIAYTGDTLPADQIKRTDFLIASAFVSSENPAFSVRFARGTSEDNFGKRSPSTAFDEIQLTPNHGNSPSKTQFNDLKKLFEVLRKQTSIVPRKTNHDDENSSVAVVSAEVQKLSELAAELIEGADQKRRELDGKRDELEKSYEERLIHLDDLQKKKEEALAVRRQELEKLRDELDDREHKHVRRSLRETITEDLKTSISEPVSSRSVNLFTLIAAFTLIFAAMGAGFYAIETQATIAEVAYSKEFDKDTGKLVSINPAGGFQVYILYAKLFFASATSLALVIYVATWFKSLSSAERAHQRKLEQYVFDMNRASWSIETMLELSSSEIQEIPQSWLDSVTANMFETKETASEDASSLQALAALLNVTTEAEIGPDGPKFKLNRKSAKKAASEAPDS